MVGHPFSPFYARARERGDANPLDFTALNVALYRRGQHRWALTERRGARCAADGVAIGASEVRSTGDGITIVVDEQVALGRSPIRGHVDVRFAASPGPSHRLDEAGRHAWWPIAPSARVEVRLAQPSVSFRGQGYFDSNWGDEPLEQAFSTWSWSRAATRERAAVSYAVDRRDGTRKSIDLEFARGEVTPLGDVRERSLGRTAWWLERTVRGPSMTGVELVRTLEDTPFYSRSQLAIELGGVHHGAVHESLSLDRFRKTWVRSLIPMRMRRA